MGESVYKIGNYECSSKEEYDAIKSDMETIKKIRKSFDENNPNDVEKLLKYLDNYNEIFTSKLGEQYKNNLLKKFKSYNTEKNDIIDNSINKQIVVAKSKHSDEDIEKSQICEQNDNNISDINSNKVIVLNDTKYIRLPVDIKMPKEKNLLYLFYVFITTFLCSFLILISRKYNYIGLSNDMENVIGDSGEIALIWITLIFIITTVIGIFEYIRIQNTYKAVYEAEKKLFNDNRKKEDGSGCLLGILIIIGILIPPILIIIMIIGATFKAIPKLRWLKMNVSALVSYIVYFWGQYLVGLGMIHIFDVVSLRIKGNLKINSIIISLCVGIICVVFIYQVAKFQKKPIFYAFRAMCTVPIMIFMALLPFAGIAAYTYMLYGEKSNNSSSNMYTDPGVHNVIGHERHLDNGSVIWISPHPQTNPDGILWNNFSYKG